MRISRVRAARPPRTAHPPHSPSPARRRLRTTAAAVAVAALISPFAGTALDAAPPAHAGPSDGMTVASGAHIDSPQVYWNTAASAFDLKTKVGATAHEAATTVNWVGKGWSARSGKSQYHFTIPDKPGLEFVGQPGETFYQAPVLPEGNHLPTWIGFGADAEIPTDRFRHASLSLDVLDVDGPGTFELFTAYDDGDRIVANRLMSSTENGLRSARLVEGDHTHNTTTFSRPGTYDITYRAVARDKSTGALLSSQDTTFRWQVGGQKPAATPAPSVQERYASAPEGPVPGSYSFTAAPKQDRQRDGDDKLTTLTFDAQDTSVAGTATVLINGYHLTDMRVDKGVGSWDEQIGARASDFQVVFTPDSGPGKWISPALGYAPGQQSTAVTSAQGSAALMEKVNDPANTRLHTGDVVPADLGYDFSLTDNGNGTYRARIQMHDPNFRGFVTGGMLEKPDDEYAIEPFEGTFVNGVWEMVEDDWLIGKPGGTYTPKVTIIPHPEVRSEGVTFALDTPYSPQKGITHSGELEPDAHLSPAPTPTAEPTAQPTSQPTGEPTSQPTGQPTASPTAAPTEEPAAPPVCTNGRKLLDDGHVDLTMRRAGTGIELTLHDDSGIHTPGKSTVHAVSEVAFGVRDSGVGRRGADQADAAFDFLGAQGDTYYALPFVQKHGLLWPGYNTQEIDFATLTGPVTLSLTDAKTPKGAHFALAEQGSGFGGAPEVRLQSGTEKTSFPVTFATHAHPMWVFTKPGAYELTFQAAATGADGTELIGQKQTLHVHVGKAAIETCLGTAAESETPSPEPTAEPSAEPTSEPTSTTDPTEPPKATAEARDEATDEASDKATNEASDKATDETTDEASAEASDTAAETSGPADDASSHGGTDSGGSGGSAGSGSTGVANAGGSAGGGSIGSLPRTGGSLMALGLALPLLGAGGALLLAARRRRR